MLNTETTLDLIAVTEAALKEITELGHELIAQVIPVTDNGPTMKSRRFRCEKDRVVDTHTLAQVSTADHRTRGALSWVVEARASVSSAAKYRTELIEAVKSYRWFYTYERLHMSLGYRTPAAVYLTRDGQEL